MKVKAVLEQLWKCEGLRVGTGASDGVSECTVSQELLRLWYEGSSRTRELERLQLEYGTKRLVKDSKPKASVRATVRRRLWELTTALE
jgi:hypothetical protein